MGNVLSRIRLLLSHRRRPPVGRPGPIPVSRNPAARPGRGHPGAPAPANQPHQPRRPPPASFTFTPRRPCPLPQTNNSRVGILSTYGASRKKMVLSAFRPATCGYGSNVKIAAAGPNFHILCVPSVQIMKPTKLPQSAKAERIQDHPPKRAGNREEGAQTRQDDDEGTHSAKALCTSGLQSSGTGPTCSRPRPLHLQALPAEAEPASAASPEPSAPPRGAHVQPPGEPPACASVGSVPRCSQPGTSAAGEQPADARRSPAGPPTRTNVAEKKPPEPAPGSAAPQCEGKRACKRKHPMPEAPQLPPPQLPRQWGRGEFPPPPKLPCVLNKKFQAANHSERSKRLRHKRAIPSFRAGRKKLALSAFRSATCGDRSNVKIVAAGRNFDTLSVPSVQIMEPIKPAPWAKAEIIQDHPPKRAGHGDVGAETRQEDDEGTRSAKALCTSGLQSSGTGPTCSRPRPLHLQALPAEAEPASAASPEPSAPPQGAHVQPPGEPPACASVGSVPCCSLPRMSAAGEQPADARRSPAGPPTRTNVAEKKPPEPAPGSAAPQCEGKRACKRKHPMPEVPQLPPPQLPRQWGRGEFPPPPKLPCVLNKKFQAANHSECSKRLRHKRAIPSFRAGRKKLALSAFRSATCGDRSSTSLSDMAMDIDTTIPTQFPGNVLYSPGWRV